MEARTRSANLFTHIVLSCERVSRKSIAHLSKGNKTESKNSYEKLKLIV